MAQQIYPYVMMAITFISFALLTYGLGTYSHQRRIVRERYRARRQGLPAPPGQDCGQPLP